MKPKKHQVKFARGYKDKDMLVHEGGTGKTVCACLWLADGRDRNALVVCPKRVVMKWQETLAEWGTSARVVSKEQFKMLVKKGERFNDLSALVVDEADEFASPIFTRDRSQLTTDMYGLVKSQDVPTLLLTATPIRSNPWNLHTLLTFLGKYVDWKKWREAFFTFGRRPWLPHPAWLPKDDWRARARKVLERNADIVLFKDVVDDMPPATEEDVKVKCPPLELNPEWEPAAAFSAEHRNEQLLKPEKVVEIGREYRKVLVVAHYREQCEQLMKELSKDRLTYMVHGGVKDQERILSEANGKECDECFLIVQASLGAGFDADTFSCVVFASMSYSVRDWVQMKFRVRRIRNLHPVRYLYLLAGRCDRAVLETIRLGREFVPSEWSPKQTDETA